MTKVAIRVKVHITCHVIRCQVNFELKFGEILFFQCSSSSPTRHVTNIDSNAILASEMKVFVDSPRSLRVYHGHDLHILYSKYFWPGVFVSWQFCVNDWKDVT